MSFYEEISAALPTIYDEAGDAAYFTPESGDLVELQILIRQETDPHPAGFETVVGAQYTTVQVQISDIGRVPRRDETFTPTEGAFADITYKVKALLENRGLQAKFEVIPV